SRLSPPAPRNTAKASAARTGSWCSQFAATESTGSRASLAARLCSPASASQPSWPRQRAKTGEAWPTTRDLRSACATYSPANPGLGERKMFGGLIFMLDGNMCCGIVGNRLMLRLGADLADQALARPHVHPMD